MANKILSRTIAAVISMGIAHAYAAESTPSDSSAGMGGAIQGMEKCYGIAKAGQNDCGNASHSCSGEAKVDNSKTDWLYTPTGLCQRIVGGSTKTPEENT